MLMMLIVLMSQFQVVKADSGDVFATLLAYVSLSRNKNKKKSTKRRRHDVFRSFQCSKLSVEQFCVGVMLKYINVAI